MYKLKAVTWLKRKTLTSPLTQSLLAFATVPVYFKTVLSANPR
jgi:hypothetical protein